MSESNRPSNGSNRRDFLRVGLASGVAAGAWPAIGGCASTAKAPHAASVPAFELDEATIADLSEAMRTGRHTARSIARAYLDRIDAVDRRGPALRSVIETNPDALAIADALDEERKAKGPRGPLHGIPVLVKDNVDTADRMATTAGSLALVGSRPPADAFLVRRLRAAGAVILGKTNLSEWANARAARSTSGWSGRGGLTRNPNALDRNTSGSSSGSGAAVSANLCAIAVGTETDGSIISPSSVNGLVGVKPTVGLVSRTGVIPISATQDTAGPMARTVRDAAILLGALAGADPEDAATRDAATRGVADYSKSLVPDGLRGARIGVVRRYCGIHPRVDRLVEDALDVMRRAGATVVDPAEKDRELADLGDPETMVLQFELKAGLNAYLARLGAGAPVKTMKEIIEFNERHASEEMPYFGQEFFLAAEKTAGLDDAKYVEARDGNLRRARAEGIDAMMDRSRLDALVAPSEGPAWATDLVCGDRFLGSSTTAAAVAGYPSVTVPAGAVFGLPVGISFFGRAWSEPLLLKIAYGFEEATRHRRKPAFLETADFRV